MRKISMRASLAVCVLALVPIVASAAPAGPEGVDEAWVTAMKAGSLDGVLACYGPDAVLWFPGTPEASGAKTIREAYAGFLGAMAVQDVTLADRHYETSGDLASGWGHFSMTVQPKKGGDPVVMKGRYLEALKKVGGRWMYVADHASIEPPPAPAAKP